MYWFSTSHWTRRRGSRLGLSVFIILTLFVVVGSASAAELFDDEVYHLQEGETVQDDLIVFGREIIIDGTVEGDLVAFGQSIMVNGMVEEDVFAAGAQVLINGIVQDDVRVGGAAITINGRVGDDLLAAGGAFIPGFGAIPITLGDRSVMSGLTTGSDATIGGDAYLAGGVATLEGTYRSNLFAAVAELVFNAEVEGDAVLESGDLTFGDSAYVAGELTYSAPAESGDAEAGGGVTKEEPEEEEDTARGRQKNPVMGFGWWLMRTILVIAGIVLVGILLLALSRDTLTRPASAIERKPVMAGLYGVLAAVAAVPLSAAMVFLAFLFFGWFWGGVASFAFCFGFLLLAWVLSPALTGLWLGRQVFSWINREHSDYYALLVGASVIVLAGRILGAIPCAGLLAYMVIYLASFALAAGGVLLSRNIGDTAPADDTAEA